MSTIVVSPIEFDGTEIELGGATHHHLFRVKRLKVGESVRVVDGEGRARGGVVARLDRNHGVVALGAALGSREPALRVELLVAPPKLERASWLVEKATELGVAAIRFVPTDRAARDERSYGMPQLSRLRRIAVAAVEQCGRAVVPEVALATSLEGRLLELKDSGARLLALDTRDEAPAERSSNQRIFHLGQDDDWATAVDRSSKSADRSGVAPPAGGAGGSTAPVAIAPDEELDEGITVTAVYRGRGRADRTSSLRRAPKGNQGDDRSLVLPFDESSSASASRVDLALLVGPEGGWSDAERRLFVEKEIPSWSLGETILRVETAAVIAAGAVLARARARSVDTPRPRP